MCWLNIKFYTTIYCLPIKSNTNMSYLKIPSKIKINGNLSL